MSRAHDVTPELVSLLDGSSHRKLITEPASYRLQLQIELETSAMICSDRHVNEVGRMLLALKGDLVATTATFFRTAT